MKTKGIVVRFDELKGFGFIRCDAVSQDIFFHIRDYQGTSTPSLGLAVDFEEIHVGGKGPRAMAIRADQRDERYRPSGDLEQVRPPQNRQNPRNVTKSRTPPIRRAPQTTESPPLIGVGALTLIWIGLLTFGVLRHKFPAVIGVGALGINLITFFAYWLDKHAAQKGQWRTKEDTLHLWSLVGGWPAARFAQEVLRHKTVKASFQSTYWATVWLHLGGLTVYIFWERIKPLLN